jgi:thioredoxin reductase (NADPH)
MADLDLNDIAFPTLDAGQIAELSSCSCTTRRHYDAGQALFNVGDQDFPFFVVESGEVEILDTSGDTPKRLTSHGPGQFTGDISHVTGRPAIVTGVALTPCEVYVVANDALRELLNVSPAISDVILQAFIARRELLRRSGVFTGVRVIGSRYSPDTFRISDFLASNRVLYTWLDLEREHDAEVTMLLKRFGLKASDTPVVITTNGLLRNPSNRQLAAALGIRRPLERSTYVLEGAAPGGQAGRSMRIENYLGFPTGITGADLTDRATLQANKFGAVLSVPSSVTALDFVNGYALLSVDSGETVAAKCLLVASGAEYLRLDAEGCSEFEGSGVYYAATPNEERLCKDQEVVVVGGGNSAGQAAVYLAGHATKVLVLVRGDSLGKSMSSYLEHRIEQTPNIEVLFNTAIVRMRGDDRHLRSIDIVNRGTGAERTLQTPAVFSFIGAVPRTDWMAGQIETDGRGFIRTGSAVTRAGASGARRERFLLETSRAGVFAAGDVRAGSVKRVASAVGEGAMSVQFVHEHLKAR